MSLLVACALHLQTPPLSSVSVIHQGGPLPPPASHLTTAFETVFSEEMAYFALFSGDIFKHVSPRGVTALAQCIVLQTSR